MNEILKAADEVRKLNRMFQALETVVTVLDRIGTMEQAENEARAKLEAIDRDVAAAEADAKVRMDALADEHANRIGAINAAKEEAEAIVAKATDDALRIREQASKDAEGVIATAEIKRKSLVSDAEAIAAQVAELHLQRAAVEAKVEKAQAALDDMRKRIG